MTREKDWIMTRNARSGNGACTAYVHSRITLYHASKIDLRYCRSLHSCSSCTLGQVDDLCGAIHFGVCSPVNFPAGRQGTVSGSTERAVSCVSTSPGSPSSNHDGSTIYHSSANFSAPTNTKDKLVPRTRSLAILREGHELAGMHLDHRPIAHQSGLMRLHPQRQVVVQGPSILIGGAAAGAGQPGSELIISSLGSAGRGRGGGVSISIQRGQTHISSSGGTAIKIQGQGHEIHIQGRGGQNIRVQPAVGHAGHVIRIHGQGHQDQLQYPSYSAVTPVAANSPIDVARSTATLTLPIPRTYSSTTQFQPQKPTARVAPAPVPPQICTPPPVLTPATTLSPSPVLSSSCPDSPTCSQETPPFPVCSPVSSLSETPASSPSPSPSPPPTSQIATVQPPVTQPVPSGSNKDADAGNSLVSQAVLSAPKPSPEVLKGRQSGSIKDISSQVNGDGLLHQNHEVFPGNRKLYGKDVDNVSQPTHERLQGFNDTTSEPPRIPTKTQVDIRDKENKVKKRGSRPYSSMHIPQFYFPSGKPATGLEVETILQKVAQVFAGLEGGKAYKQQMGAITKASGLPLFWKILLFRSAGGTSDGFISYQSLSILLKKLYQSCHDEASKFMRLVAKPGASVLDFEDFEPLVQDVVESHPGLTFLQDAPEFHSRYVTTVISRVMFCVNRSWTGKITVPELRKSNFLQTLARLEEEDDINQIKDYFSYEHFYVIYCKFWELDKDHDLFIDKNDLSRHNDHGKSEQLVKNPFSDHKAAWLVFNPIVVLSPTLNSRLVDRIFSGAVTRGPEFHEGKMSYKEFVWFLLAEEDKRHPTSIEYWFRCMDLDGDGVISMYEMEYFHEEQMNKMETLGIERLPFEDTVCQMMDMVGPKQEGKITLSDLKACKMTNIFFDTFFNLDKFLDHEQRDPFANARDPNSEPAETSDWNRYAEIEYDNLVADEGNADMDDGNYEDDFEPEDDEEMIRDEMLRLADTAPPQQRTSGQVHSNEDIYDFSNTSNLGY